VERPAELYLALVEAYASDMATPAKDATLEVLLLIVFLVVFGAILASLF
jgi:hypothetical protein